MDIDMKTIYFPLFIYGMGMGLKGTSMRHPDYITQKSTKDAREWEWEDSIHI